MADVASRQQTTALILFTIVTRTRRHKELTKKNDKPDGKPVLCQRTFSLVFRAVFFNTVKLHSLTWGVWGPLHPSSVQLITTSPFAYEISNITVLGHTPDIADERILKLNFAEKDHRCKPSLASSSHCIDKVYSDTVGGKQNGSSVSNKTIKLSICN